MRARPTAVGRGLARARHLARRGASATARLGGRGPLPALSGALLGLTALVGVACSTVDPGPNFVIADENFDADFFFCRVEPEVLFAKKCGPGDPGQDPANGCHFNSSAVSGMPLADHAPVACDNGRVANRAQVGAGSAAQGNLQSASLAMSRDVLTAPIYLRPAGQNHPRAIFGREDAVVEVLRQWAAR